MFTNSRSKLHKNYYKWEGKYRLLLNGHIAYNTYLNEVGVAKTKLTKPLNDYAKKKKGYWLTDEYFSKKAETVRILDIKTNDSILDINNLLINDEPSIEHEDISKLYHNLKFIYRDRGK